MRTFMWVSLSVEIFRELGWIAVREYDMNYLFILYKALRLNPRPLSGDGNKAG